MNEPYRSEARCAYELCQKSRPIEIIPGHRRKLYHDENCRQAQHRLLEARVLLATLRQFWSDYLPATQHLLEDILARQGEACVRSVAAAITAERDQARHPALSEDEQTVLKGQWSDLQRGTQQILESLLSGDRGDPSTLFHLILLAIKEERRHAQCNNEQDQRAADLDITLSAYRQIVDLDDRAKLIQQFLVVGQLLDYRPLAKFRVEAGLQAWQDYQSWTYEDTLAEAIVYGREVLAEEAAARSEAQELRERMDAAPVPQTAPVPAVLAIQAYFHARAGASLPLQRNSHTLQLTALRSDGVAAATGYGLVTLSTEELHHLAAQTGMTILAPDQGIEHVRGVDQEHQVMQTRLCAIAERLQYCRLLTPPIQPGAESWQQFAESGSYEQLCQAVKTAEHYYENLIYLDELEQRGRHAAQEKQQKSRPRQVEQELMTAQAETRKLQRELTRYEPPPRELLECTLRQWCKRTNVFLHTPPLTGEELDAYIREFSDRRILSSIASGESCYFIGKYRRRRIAIIAKAIEQGQELLYRGDPDLIIKGINAQGTVTLATGQQCWLNTDDVEQFWALIVAEAGQQDVGGNTAVSSLQQYLCMHPGQALPVRYGKEDIQIILVDDDRLAITMGGKLKRLYDDELEQARRWIREQS